MGQTQLTMLNLSWCADVHFFWVFLGVVEAVFGRLLCCGVDIVQCLLKYVIWWGTRPQRQRTTAFFQTVGSRIKRTYAT